MTGFELTVCRVGDGAIEVALVAVREGAAVLEVRSGSSRLPL